MGTTNFIGYANMAALAAFVANNWQRNYPNYSTKFIHPAELKNRALEFSAKLAANGLQTTANTGNPRELKAVNRRLDAAVLMLKRFIQFEYRAEKDLSACYMAYGLSLAEKNFSLPKDNTERGKALATLVAKLSESGNPFADKDPGLAYFQALQTEYLRFLGDDKNTDNIVVSEETHAYVKNTEKTLRRLISQIKSDFPKEKLPTVLRNFGFLKEV